MAPERSAPSITHISRFCGGWRNDANLQRCSWAARGVWLEIMGFLCDSGEYGILRWPLLELARAAGAPAELVRELVSCGVLNGHDAKLSEPLTYTPRSGRRDGATVTLVGPQKGPIWYSSRMVRDEYVGAHSGARTRFGVSPRHRQGERQGERQSERQSERLTQTLSSPPESSLPSSSRSKAPVSGASARAREPQPNLRILGVIGGKGGGGNGGSVSLPEQRARLQARLAEALGARGWTVVSSAADENDKDHAANLALCKRVAESRGIRWPRSWV